MRPEVAALANALPTFPHRYGDKDAAQIIARIESAGYVVCPVAFPNLPKEDLVAVPRALLMSDGSGRDMLAKGKK